MRAKRHVDLGDVGHELNLIPYMDIMVNLVLFMLASTTSFMSLTILNASIPQIATDSSQAMAAMKKAQLLLMVRIEKNGIVVDPNVQGGKGIKASRIRKVDQEYNYEKLKETISAIKARFEDETRVLIIAVPNTKYDHVIKTMDAVRETKPGMADLFPDVTLSII